MTDPGGATGSTGFSLRKWYLDVTDQRGGAVIGYHLSLRWGVLRLMIGGLIRVEADGGLWTASAVGRQPAPTLHGERVAWTARRWHLAGTWERQDPGFARTLFSSPRGDVRWDCLMPRARASLTMDRGRTEGWGYVERLDLTLRPWHLPIDELHWGRFASDSGSVVWLRWIGPEPREIVLVDGEPAAAGGIDATGVVWNDHRLELSDSRTIRSGPLGSTALRSAGWVRLITPASVRGMMEHKWISRGALFRGGAAATTGWAIHEIVRFPRGRPS